MHFKNMLTKCVKQIKLMYVILVLMSITKSQTKASASQSRTSVFKLNNEILRESSFSPNSGVNIIIYRNENTRWKKMAAREFLRTSKWRTRRKRAVATHLSAPTPDQGSQPFVNISNKGLIEFNATMISAANHATVLDLSSNNLTQISVDLQHLLSLNLSDNKIQKFFRNKLPQLQTLDISLNNIKDLRTIHLTELTQLRILNLSCNVITTIPDNFFHNMTAIKILNLSCNQLIRLSQPLFIDLIGIDTLLLAYNNISSIANDTFSPLTNLRYLDLAYNNIHQITTRSLQGIENLLGLSIAFNQELGVNMQIFVSSWSLKELDVSATGLCRIPAALTQSVQTLFIADNHIRAIRCGDIDSYPLLQHLDLSLNLINMIQDDALGRLEMLTSLNLNDNHLENIPSNLPPSLINLKINNNHIHYLQESLLSPLANLELLDLSGNKLTYLTGLPLPRLITLNLRNCHIKSLGYTIVKTSPQLRDLLLENNEVECADLSNIAQWASICQQNYGSNKEDRFRLGEDNKSGMMLETMFSYNRKSSCLLWHKNIDLSKKHAKPMCASEKQFSDATVTGDGRIDFLDVITVKKLMTPTVPVMRKLINTQKVEKHTDSILIGNGHLNQATRHYSHKNNIYIIKNNRFVARKQGKKGKNELLKTNSQTATSDYQITASSHQNTTLLPVVLHNVITNNLNHHDHKNLTDHKNSTEFHKASAAESLNKTTPKIRTIDQLTNHPTIATKDKMLNEHSKYKYSEAIKMLMPLVNSLNIDASSNSSKDNTTFYNNNNIMKNQKKSDDIQKLLPETSAASQKPVINLEQSTNSELHADKTNIPEQINPSLENNIPDQHEPQPLNATQQKISTINSTLFIVIGVTLGILLSIGVIQLYRCDKQWRGWAYCRHRQIPININNTNNNNNNYTNHKNFIPPKNYNLLPMDIFDVSTIYYADQTTNNKLW